MELKVFKLEFDEAFENVFAISYVPKGAVKEGFIYLSETENVKLAINNDEERLVTGILMKPDFRMKRNGKKGEEDYYIEFSKEAVKLSAQDYLKNYHQYNTTKNHDEDVPDVFLAESWVVEDKNNDKANALGLNVSDGDWVVTQKINDDALWESIKSEEVMQLSLEGRFRSEEVELNINDKKSIMAKEETKVESKDSKATTMLENVKLALGLSPNKNTEEIDSLRSDVNAILESVTLLLEQSNEKTEEEIEAAKIADALIAEEVALASHIAEISKWMQEVVNDSFEIGDKVERKGFGDDAPNEKISAGEYELDDRRKILIDGDGYIQFIKPAPKDAKVETETEDKTEVKEETKEEVKEEVAVEAKEVVEVKPKEEVKMVSLSAGTEKKLPKVKYDPKMTTTERIKAQLGIE